MEGNEVKRQWLLFLAGFSHLVYLYNNDTCLVIQIKYASKLFMYIQNAFMTMIL
jgi:hypothetical protein